LEIAGFTLAICYGAVYIILWVARQIVLTISDFCWGVLCAFERAVAGEGIALRDDLRRLGRSLRAAIGGNRHA
jgi:hypothetical protein